MREGCAYVSRLATNKLGRQGIAKKLTADDASALRSLACGDNATAAVQVRLASVGLPHQ
jgi:hypothetical protein